MYEEQYGEYTYLFLCVKGEKLVYQNKNEVPGTSMAFYLDSFQVWKKSLPT